MYPKLYEQIEFPYPTVEGKDHIIEGLDDDFRLIIPQRLTKAVFAVGVTPEPFCPESITARDYQPQSNVPNRTFVRGTGFRFHSKGLFVTAAHLFDDDEWQRLVNERRLIGICAMPGKSWTPLPIVAISLDSTRDVAIGLLPKPTNESDADLVGHVPVSFELPPSNAGMAFAAGFQDTQQDDERIRLQPILFRGTGYSRESGPYEVKAAHRIVSVQESVVRVPMKARPGLSGAPLIIFSGPDGKDELAEGRVYGVQSFIREVDPELTLAHFIPIHHAYEIELDHDRFGGIRGKTLNQAFKFE